MRKAFSLLELVMAIGITSILLMGMSASIVIAARAVGDGVDVVGQALETSDVLSELASDISSAEVFTERTDTSVTMTVSDRDGDGQGEVIRYRWTGASDARLIRQVNGGPEVVLARDVQQFSLSYGVKTMAGEEQDEPAQIFTGRTRRPFWKLFWDHVVKRWVDRRRGGENGGNGNSGNNGNGGGNGNHGNGGGNGNHGNGGGNGNNGNGGGNGNNGNGGCNGKGGGNGGGNGNNGNGGGNGKGGGNGGGGGRGGGRGRR